MVNMSNISIKSKNRLRTVFLNCDPFISHNQLKALFVDNRIVLWRDQLPEMPNLASRVDATIEYLSRLHNQAYDENGLVLFLQVLCEQFDPQDARHHELNQLITELQTLSKNTFTQEAICDSSSNYLVLVIEDEPDWQGRLKRYLEKINCTVLTADSYDAARTQLNYTRPNLVTVDLNLDKLTKYADGFELLDDIRNQFGAEFPIIIVTGKGDMDKMRDAFFEYKVFDFIQKSSINQRDFQQRVLKALQ